MDPNLLPPEVRLRLATDCGVCGPEDAPRPTGVREYVYGLTRHYAAECAAMASIDETPVRTEEGYRSESGSLVCMECFDYGLQHAYAAGEDPHERYDPRRRHDPHDPRRRHDTGSRGD